MLKGIIEKVGRLSNTIFPRIVTLKGGKNSSKLLDWQTRDGRFQDISEGERERL